MRSTFHTLETIRYDYAFFKCPTKAEFALDEMWACGDVGTLEQPKIERRATDKGTRWIITLNG
jgi:hypothetical protein